MKDIKTNLEARIAKAIKENTCPYTTDADIRYFETEEYQEVAYPSDKPYGHSILEMATENPELCICGKSLENTAEHYIHMTSGY